MTCTAEQYHHGPGDPVGHCDPVPLPDGTNVWAASFPVGGYDGRDTPDYGLYFDARWQPPWPHSHVDWPDFGLPVDRHRLLDGLDDVLHRARAEQRVEVGCIGGHGRTGTALACLAVLVGIRSDPVEWVRTIYCPRAVETEDQVEFVCRLQTEH